MALGLVPLGAVAVHGRRLSRAWWVFGIAFAVSFGADLAALLIQRFTPGPPGFGHQVVSQTYPLLQASLFALILAPQPLAIPIICTLAMASGISLGVRGGEGFDVLLHVVGWLSVSALAWWVLAKGALRHTLTVGFVALSGAWVWFALDPTFAAWGAVQAVRLAMAVGFVVATVETARARRAV